MWLTRSRNWILPRLKYFQTNKKLRFCSRKLETFKKYFNDFESRKPVFNSNKNVNITYIHSTTLISGKGMMQVRCFHYATTSICVFKINFNTSSKQRYTAYTFAQIICTHIQLYTFVRILYIYVLHETHLPASYTIARISCIIHATHVYYNILLYTFRYAIHTFAYT